MITPRKAFLSLVIGIAIFPVFPFNMFLVPVTWAVLGIKKAIQLLLLSFIWPITQAIPGLITIYLSVMDRVTTIITQTRIVIASCPTQSCVTTAVHVAVQTAQSSLSGVLAIEMFMVPFFLGSVVFSILRIWWMVKGIRKHTMSIRKYYWGGSV